LQLTAGASEVEDSGSHAAGYLGYNTSASFGRTKENNSFRVYYAQVTGQSSGLGSVSDTRSAGVSVSRTSNRVRIYVDAGAFDTHGTLDNRFGTRGVQGTVTIGIPLTPKVYFQGGVQYQGYDRSSPYGFDQKRAFLSLHYENPSWLRFAK